MKKYLLLLFLISPLTLAQYTTPGTGVIWELDSLVSHSGGVVTGSFPNYTITNKVFISENDFIWIVPGSILNFTIASSGFEVNGILKAEGTAENIITFTSPILDSLGFYEGLRFNENAETDTMRISKISFALIEYADYGMRVIDANPIIANSHIYKCGRGIQLSGSNSVISFNKIERCYEYGILINLDSNPIIEDNEICFNNTQGTSAKNQVSIGLQGNNSPVIKNNIIYGGESIPTGGISLWVSGSANFSNMLCEGNTIYNNSFGITLYSTSSGIINAVVKDNLIYNNNINPNALASGSGININGSPANQPVIAGNEIYGNWWGITIQNGSTVQAGPQPNIGNVENDFPGDDGENIIYGNIQGADVFDFYNNCTNEIYAQNNDWRVYDSTSIEEHIFHDADDTAHGLVKFIPFSDFIPVELISFSANVIDNSILLEWKTASETNNRGFEVERRNLSKGETLEEWVKTGFVEGNGTTTSNNGYSFFDENLSGETYQYRLKQIDFDGSYKFSNIVEAEINIYKSFSLGQNYPNPFNPATRLSFAIGKPSFVSLKVYDVLGNEIATLVNEFKPAGRYEITFDASAGGLASGIYLYTLKAGRYNESKKFVLMK